MSDLIATILLVLILFALGWILALSACFYELENSMERTRRFYERQINMLFDSVNELERKQ